MTSKRVLKFDDGPIKPGDIINRLQDVALKLHEVEKLNDEMQSQFASGSTSWLQCEQIDAKLHEIATLLGE